MSYLMEIGCIPAPGLGTTVLVGSSFRPSCYSVKIGLVRLELPQQWDSVRIDDPIHFRNFQQAYIDESRNSIFDIGPSPSIISTKAVEFTQAEKFASGPDFRLTSFDLKTILRTILPEHDGGVTVLQLMLNRHAPQMHLAAGQSTDYYASVVYDVIGGPIAEDKKADA